MRADDKFKKVARTRVPKTRELQFEVLQVKTAAQGSYHRDPISLRTFLILYYLFTIGHIWVLLTIIIDKGLRFTRKHYYGRFCFFLIIMIH